MTKTNPTAAEFAAALATHEAAERELNALAGHHGEEYNQAEQRYRAAFEAVVRDVRPTDLPSVVRQLRWYLEEIGGGIDDEPMLMHIAAQLEAIGAPRPMPGGDLANLWRQRQQAFAEYASFDDESAKKDVAHDRLCEIDDQIRAARPTDLAGLAIQLQAVLDRPLDSDSEVLEHIAQQLEAMAVPAPTRDDPHPAWFAEMMGERRARQSGNWSEERYRDSLLSECEMQTRIASTPPATAAGALVQLLMLRDDLCEGEAYEDDDLRWGGTRGVVGPALRSLETWLRSQAVMQAPTPSGELADLWREWQDLAGGMDRGEVSTDTDGPAWQRLETVDTMIREARTCDPAGLAVQARILADSLHTGRYDGDHTLALVIAEQLERLAGASRWQDFIALHEHMKAVPDESWGNDGPEAEAVLEEQSRIIRCLVEAPPSLAAFCDRVRLMLHFADEDDLPTIDGNLPLDDETTYQEGLVARLANDIEALAAPPAE